MDLIDLYKRRYVADYPELEKEDIQAVLLYAGQLIEEERVFKVGV